MKNRIVSVCLLIVMILTLTGCVKFNANMDIKATKSMDFSIIYAFDTSLFGDENMLDDDMTKEMEDKGFKLEDYQDGKMKGFKISKKIKNIDDVSSLDDVVFDLSGFMNDDGSDIQIFKVKKGLFKNVYTAKLTFDTSDSGFDNSMDMDDLDSGFSGMDIDYSSMLSNLDLSFSLNLPFKAKSNNASSVSANGKELSWNLNDITSNGIQSIEFEFELYNLLIFGVIAGVIVLVLILVIIIFKGKKGSKKTKNANVQDQIDVTNTSMNNEQSNVLETNSMNIEQLSVPDNNSINIEQLNVPDTNSMNIDQLNVQDTNPMNIEQPSVPDANSMNTEQLNVSDVNSMNIEQPNVSDVNSINVEELNVPETNTINIEPPSVPDINQMNVEQSNVSDNNQQTNIQPMPPFGDQSTQDILDIAFGKSFSQKNDTDNQQ